MEIKVGYELIYDCPRPTPMMLVLNIHHSRASDIIVPDRLNTTPFIPFSTYRDSFGNWCTRLVAPTGQLRIATMALVKDSGEPDIVATSAQQHSIEELPEEALLFLLGSRYCDTEKFPEVAWSLFGQTPSGWAGSRQSVISYTTICHLAMSMPALPELPGKRSTRGEASAAISHILRLHSADA